MPPRPSAKFLDDRPTFTAKDGNVGRIDHKGRPVFGWAVRHGHFLDRPVVSLRLRRMKRRSPFIMALTVRSDIGRLLDIVTPSVEDSLDRARIWRTTWRDPWTGAESPALALGSAHDPAPATAYVFTVATPSDVDSFNRAARFFVRMPAMIWGIDEALAAELMGRRLEIPDRAWRLDVLGDGERRRLVFRVPDELAPSIAAAPQMVRVRYVATGVGSNLWRKKGRWMPYDQIPPDPLGIDFGGSARSAHLYRKARLTHLARKVEARLERKKNQEQQKETDDGVPADST